MLHGPIYCRGIIYYAWVPLQAKTQKLKSCTDETEVGIKISPKPSNLRPPLQCGSWQQLHEAMQAWQMGSCCRWHCTQHGL